MRRARQEDASQVRRLHGLRGLALLLFLTGCAAKPSMGGPQQYRQQAVEVDFEAASPQWAGELHQKGVHLPRSSRGLADPRSHRDFVEHRVTAVGFGITAGGYLLYCDGLPLPVLVPESHVDLTLTRVEPLNESIYSDRDTALADMEARAPGAGRYAYYRGAGGALIVPTLFSPATTPRIAWTMLEVRKHLSETLHSEMKVLLLTLTGTKTLQGAFSRVMRVGSGPAPRPLPRNEGKGGQAPSSPKEAPTPPPHSPIPSPGLVQALTGKNPTLPVARGQRLPQDAAASPAVPRPRETDRPIGRSPSQNAQLQVDLRYLRTLGARNIRVNQQQLSVENGQRVGINRPDLQFDYNGRRYHVEYDTPNSGRGPRHQARITSNDPDAEIILLVVP